MKRICIVLTAASVLASAPSALAEGETVSAYGTSQIAIAPKNPKSESSIAAAVADAQKRALPAAVEKAKARATDLAVAANLVLGSILSVEEQGPSPFVYAPFGAGGAVVGPFNGKFCGKTTRAIFGTVNGKRKVVRRVKQRRCYVPPFASTTVEVTFRAAPKI